MKGTMNTQLGRIVIDTDVIATYAGSVAVECICNVGMPAVIMKEGHGFYVSLDEVNMFTIDFHLIVAYGVSILTISENLMETVKYKVEEFTGMQIDKINIFVEGVRVID